MDYALRMCNMVKEAAQAAQAHAKQLAARGVPVAMYLYYLPATAQQDGKLLLVDDNTKEPEGFKLATGEGLRGGVPYVNYGDWIHSRSTRLPILATED